MDPWQQTVESRLGELRTDIRELRSDIGAVKARIDHLPTKSFIVTALLASLGACSAISVFAAQIRALFGVH